MTFKEWWGKTGLPPDDLWGSALSAWNAALEEAAKVVEGLDSEWGTDIVETTDAIRAMKETP